jgi:type 1 glutamine amidotransferase
MAGVALCSLVIRGARAGEEEVSGAVHIVLLADTKDHGPAGNGLHDYPQWQKRWAGLLGGEEAATEKREDPARAGVPGVRVTTAWKWPSDDQFQTADVIVAYCYLAWNDVRLAQVRRYLDAGGGLVLIHSATWTRPRPSRDVAEVIGIGGFRRYRHGPVRLDIAAPDHPICQGLPEKILLGADETYWPPTPMIDRVLVLASSGESQEPAGNAAEAAQPMLWCYELGRGRVFGCVPGHRAKTFDNPPFRTFLLRGVAWAAGRHPDRLVVPAGGGKSSTIR